MPKCKAINSTLPKILLSILTLTSIHNYHINIVEKKLKRRQGVEGKTKKFKRREPKSRR
jgi:hypothetical protein